MYLHWSWFLLALYGIQTRAGEYSSYVWPVLEYLSLFVIVMLHEFGHSLACKQVGGHADTIVLWPFGGVAYVSPPPRPGATLWCIAAGPLVNVALFPMLTVLMLLSNWHGWPASMPDAYHFIVAIWQLDLLLLIFNLLPIYPLDGGQILRSVLWFMVGRARSLMIASTIGMVSVVLLLIFAIKDMWLGVLAVFALIQCWGGLQQARALGRMAAAPRHAGLGCPNCGAAPPAGEFWICGQCRRRFDMFATKGVCPGCGMIFNGTRCLECGEEHPLYAFSAH